MASSPRDAEREEERRLNMRTLTIASAASAAAAAVTSQLWIAGTWIAAALTPVLVTLISEALHRPTERVARAWTSERPPGDSRRVTTTREEPTTVTGAAGPMRVYRQTGERTTLSRRRIAIGTVAVTAAIAFVVGIAALTTADLVSGGSVGKGSARLTLGGGGDEENGGGRDAAPRQEEREQDAPDRTDPAEEEEPTTGEEPTPEEEAPPAETAPTPTEPAPREPAPDPVP